MTTMIAVTITRPMTTRDVARGGRRDGQLADAGEGEDLLDDDRAAEEADELHGEHRERRAAGVAQHVLVDDAVGAEPAAAERAHVVARQSRR